MNGIIAIVLPLLISAIVDSRRIKTHNLTAYAIYLRRDTSHFFEQGWLPMEKGDFTELMDLRGTLRHQFAFEVTSVDTSISIVCSPFSALMPLGMLIFGSHDHKTEVELLKATGVHNKAKVGDYYKHHVDKLDHQTYGAIPYFASRIYISSNKTIKDHFKDKAESVFGNCIESIDMSHETETAKKINEWVENHTNGKVTDILKPSDVDTWTILMIIDAFYFSGLWKHEFTTESLDLFYGANGREELLHMMYLENTYMYGACNALGVQVAMIPFKDESVSMLVLLPYDKNGLESVLHKLKKNPDRINHIKMKNTLLLVRLPKFKIETTLDLKALYHKVGLKEIFTTEIDDIVEEGKVEIDKAVHKTFIEIHEKGTTPLTEYDKIKAKIASKILILPIKQLEKDIIFSADHSFMFFIIANKQQLLAGTFVG